MFFFSSQERLDLFKINPRKYLLPTTPRNPIRLAVAGHPGAGKSTLADLLAKHYGCDVIKPSSLVEDVSTDKSYLTVMHKLSRVWTPEMIIESRNY